jgi:hypothetical protein
VLYAIDSARVECMGARRAEGPPATSVISVDYASATPVTDGRIVVAWFGPKAYTRSTSTARRCGRWTWARRHGAYDIPTYDRGPASSPIIWNGYLQCDTQTDCPCSRSLRPAKSSEDVTRRAVIGNTDRGRDDVGTELVTNASNSYRLTHPLTRTLAIGWVVEDHRADVILLRSDRRRAAAHRSANLRGRGIAGDLTLASDQTSSDAIPEPPGRGSNADAAHTKVLYVLANNGVFTPTI